MKGFVRRCLAIALTTTVACGGGGTSNPTTSEDGSGGSRSTGGSQGSGGRGPAGGGMQGTGGISGSGAEAGTGGMGGGGAVGSGGSGPVSGALSQIMSVAPSFILSNQRYSYTPLATFDGPASWRIVDGPSGMRVADDGRVEWDPSSVDAGSHDEPHRVELEGVLGDEVVRQIFNVQVSTLSKRAEKSFLPDLIGQMSVSAPSSKIKGAGLTLPVGALLADTTIDISEMAKSPRFPNAKNPPSVVDFGPSGLSFKKPATVALPFDSSKAINLEKLGAFTFNTKLSRWESVPVVSVDMINGILHARASHFSIYAAAETSVDYQITVEAMDESSVCAGRLAARGELESGLSSLELTSVNNLSADMEELGASDVRSLIADPAFEGSLRVARVFHLTTESGATSTRIQVSTLFVAGDAGTVTHTDTFGNVIAQQAYDDYRTALDDIDDHLSGRVTHALFAPAFAGTRHTVRGRLHLVYSAGDLSVIGGATEGALGASAVSVPAGEFGLADPAAPDLDIDCDRYRGGFDSVDDSLQPKIVASPEESSTIVAGTVVRLSASVIDSNTPPTSTAWEVLRGGANATLETVQDDPAARSFVSEQAGFYTVRFTAEVDGSTLERRFTLQVLPRPELNSAPTCLPSALPAVIKVGGRASVSAAVDDAETPTDALTVEWGLLDREAPNPTLVPSAAIEGAGAEVRFAGLGAGTYDIACRAHDGAAWGAIESTQISVLAADENEEPTDFLVSPAQAQAVVGATATFRARAVDPDGDPLTYSWTHTLAGAANASDGTLSVDTSGLAAGVYTLRVSVSDGIAPPQTQSVSLRVLAAPIVAGAPDSDRDGFPQGIDCNDNNPAVHPDAVEICGNSIDENCDGVVRRNDCDEDGYSATDPSQPDCNDSNPAIHPGAFEYCDGRDNNCDGQVDEGFNVGGTCTSGLGDCASPGVLACSASRVGAACRATPRAGSTETCDGRDNDCDGMLDEGQVCTAEKVGTWMECTVSDCSTLADSGFELTSAGDIVMMSSVERSGVYTAGTTMLCVDDQGTYSVMGDAVTVTVIDEDGESRTLVATLRLLSAETARLSYVDLDTGEQRDELHRRVNGLHATIDCPDWCDLDEDQDGVDNCEDPCPHDVNDACGGTLPCGADDDGDGIDNCQDRCPHNPDPNCDPCTFDDDQDGVDNCEDLCPHDPDPNCDPCTFDDDQDGVGNCEDLCPHDPNPTCDPCEFDDDQDGVGNCEDLCPRDPYKSTDAGYCGCDAIDIDSNEDGTVDSCEPLYPAICDFDGIDNNGNGVVDETGEPCGAPVFCDRDGIDNNGDGVVDETGEHCGGTSVLYCDRDEVDNNGNGVIDETGEPCGAPVFCDRDGIDNNGNGVVDEVNEPCAPGICDTDGVDNDGDSVIDEPQEPCASTF